ncbi:hypothetical protein [Polaromonas jejuensis]|uniref:Uncharacterized protein n=1 Tax=Polaromonas jejuensis TaxID=457502 RepID=A0ABW0QMX3_9BURK|nr:hypothetical protein [Polaromonas jejuensis]
METIFKDLSPDVLQARVLILEASLAMMVRLAMQPEMQQAMLYFVQESEDNMFNLGVPEDALPLAKQIAQALAPSPE